jgi:hypothetical protein
MPVAGEALERPHLVATGVAAPVLAPEEPEQQEQRIRAVVAVAEAMLMVLLVQAPMGGVA